MIAEEKMKMTGQTNSSPLYGVIIANWDENRGPVISLIHPHEWKFGNSEIICQQVFLNAKSILMEKFWHEFSPLHLTIPFPAYGSLARVVIDTTKIPDSSVWQPFSIILMVQADFPEKVLPEFDPILDTISLKIKQSSVFNNEFLSELIVSIDEIYEKLNFEDEPEVKIDENYSFTVAVDDFKRALTEFQKQNYKYAYLLLQKPLEKFLQEKHQKLLMECLYLKVTLLIKEKKFTAAINALKYLIPIAKELNHRKYHETAQFLLGFAEYSTFNYTKAVNQLKNITIENTQFISKYRYYFIFGKSYANLEMHDLAIEAFINSYDHLSAQQSVSTPSESLLQQNNRYFKEQALISYNLALQYYYRAIEKIKHSNIDQWQELTSKNNPDLNKALEFLNTAAKSAENLQDYLQLLTVYPLIAQIYSLFENFEDQVLYLEKSVDICDHLNDFSNKIRFILQIVQIQEKFGNFEQNVNLLRYLMQDTAQFILLDRLTIAKFHFLLGKNLILANKLEEAQLELITALNHYNKMDHPVVEMEKILEFLIKLNEDDVEKKRYYMRQKEKLQEKSLVAHEKRYTKLGVLQDIWIFAKNGIELFSYAPELKFDSTLLGGFLSALQSFSKELSKQEIQSIQMGENRFDFYLESDKDFFILGRSSAFSEVEKAKKTLERIYGRFFMEYKENLQNFQGNVEIFDNFKEIIFSMDLDMI